MALIQIDILETQSAYASASLNTDFSPPQQAKYGIFFWNLSAVAGTTPVADCKLQYRGPVSGNTVDIDGAAYVQKNAAAFQVLVVGLPTVADSSGNFRTGSLFRSTPNPLSTQMRAAFTMDRTTGDETYTFTLVVEWWD